MMRPYHWMCERKGNRIRRAIPLILLLFLQQTLSSCKHSASGDKDVREVVQQWNTAHASRNAEALAEVFDETLFYYGVEQSQTKSVGDKLAFFSRHPDFYQQIVGDIQVDFESKLVARCSFLKRVTMDGKSRDYPSYLALRKIGNTWKIVSESDLITDKNRRKKGGSE